MLCSYKEACKPVSDEELRDAFDEAVYESAYFDPEVGDDGKVDQLGYIEDMDEAETSVAESMLCVVSPEIKSILLYHDKKST